LNGLTSLGANMAIKQKAEKKVHQFKRVKESQEQSTGMTATTTYPAIIQRNNTIKKAHNKNIGLIMKTITFTNHEILTQKHIQHKSRRNEFTNPV
jgi:phosphoribosyl-dephospho-CoA transferase